MKDRISLRVYKKGELMKIFNSGRLVLGAVFLFGAMSVFSATDGSLGTTSSGVSSLSITKVNSVKITGVEDIAFGSVVAAPNKSSFDVCIYSTTGSYNIRASSANGTGTNFRLHSSGNYIVYDVEWNNAASGTSGTNQDHNVTSSTLTGADSSSQSCGGGDNARVFVEVDGTSFNSAAIGTYTDTLTLLITPV